MKVITIVTIFYIGYIKMLYIYIYLNLGITALKKKNIEILKLFIR